MEYDLVFKVVVVGSTAVGKSSVLNKFVDNIFNENFVPTVGVDFRIKTMEVGESKIKLQIWDTAGQERFQSIMPTYYKGAHAILICFDITNKQSFQAVTSWAAETEKHSRADLVRILVGTKSDLEYLRQVSSDQAQRLSHSLGMRYFETSAKQGARIEQLFRHGSQQMKEKFKKPAIAPKDREKVLTKQNLQPRKSWWKCW